ncbi:hypothetical protein, partial [Shewanella sp. GutDb-MelDb]|uniref:hypothetical protein n=1 Tax=Shewanella sp. GutDb-MelDb TaxID=2058316 RepID=UPI000CB5A59F
MERDSAQYIARKKLNFARVNQLLSGLVLPNNCSNDVRQALRKIDYSEPELKFVGVVLDKQTLCTSNGIVSHNSKLNPTTYPLIRYVSEVTGQEEIAIMIKGTSNKYIVFLNKVRLRDYFSFNCQSCMSYQLKLIDEAPPLRQDSTWFVIEHDYGLARGYIIVSNELKSQVNKEYFWIYFLIYFVIFSLCITTYNLFRNRSQSVEALLIQAAN